MVEQQVECESIREKVVATKSLEELVIVETQLTKVLNNVTKKMQRLQGRGSLDVWHLNFQASMHEWNEKLVLYKSVFAAHAALSAQKVEP